MSFSNTAARPTAGGGLTAAYTGTAGTTTAVNAKCTLVRIVTTTDAYINISTDGTAATSSGTYMVANTPEYFVCSPSSRVSAIQVSSAGSVYVMPMEVL